MAGLVGCCNNADDQTNRCVDWLNNAAHFPLPQLSSMPPFGAEREERPPPKKPGFLSLSHAPKSRPSRAFTVFGAEPAENACHSELNRAGGLTSSLGRCSAALPTGPFGSEPDEERTQPRAKIPRTVSASVFGDEPEETSGEAEHDSGDSGSDDDFLPQKETVFSLGWHCVTNLQYSSFWKDNIADPKSKRVTRAYDNSKRRSSAAYTREQHKDLQKKNGADPERLKRLFQAGQCQCSLLTLVDSLLFMILVWFVDVISATSPSLSNLFLQCVGARKTCYKQYSGSKELPAFVHKFWSLSKQDQDALVLGQNWANLLGSYPTQIRTMIHATYNIHILCLYLLLVFIVLLIYMYILIHMYTYIYIYMYMCI